MLDLQKIINENKYSIVIFILLCGVLSVVIYGIVYYTQQNIEYKPYNLLNDKCKTFNYFERCRQQDECDTYKSVKDENNTHCFSKQWVEKKIKKCSDLPDQQCYEKF